MFPAVPTVLLVNVMVSPSALALTGDPETSAADAKALAIVRFVAVLLYEAVAVKSPTVRVMVRVPLNDAVTAPVTPTLAFARVAGLVTCLLFSFPVI
jgi:hypothetical protein